MAIPIQMPKLSDTMEEGLILKWLKREGDRVQPGEVLAEVETDKANMELEAFDEGTLLKILVEAGQRVPVGAPIAVLGEPGEDISGILAELSVALAAKAKEAEKSPETGTAEKVEVSVAGVSAELAPAEEVKVAAAPGKVKASPLARKLALEHGLDLRGVQGSGPEGRIVKRDVEALLAQRGAAETTTTPEGSLQPASQPVAATEDYEDIPLSMMREAVAKRMVQSKAPVPHFYLTVEVDMDALVELRESLKDVGDVKISYNDIIVKAVALNLRRHPEVNASFQGNVIRRYKRVHVGVAVAVEEGLITPVVRDCDGKSLGQIARELRELSERARQRKLRPEEYTGATFTVSNLGMYGIEAFSAVINPPEGAILAVGAIVEKPVVKEGAIVVGHRARLTLSCDHRVIDGATGAQFLMDLKQMLENPLSLMV